MISNWGIRSRVLLAALLPVVVLAVLMTVFFIGWRLSELELAHGERGRALARQLAAAAEFPLFAGNRDALRQLALNIAAEQDVLGVQIHAPAGNLLARAGLPVPGLPERTLDHAFQQELGEALRVVEPVRPSRLNLDDDPSSEALDEQDQSPLLGSIILDLSREPLSQQRAEALKVGASVLLAVLFGSVLLAQLLGRGVSQPVRRIADAVSRIGEGHLSERVPVLGGGSLAQLSRGFNEMAARLEVAHEDLLSKIEEATAELRARKEEAERASLAKSRFLAAASHDLRQPMHALGLFIAELSQQPHAPETAALVRKVAHCAEAMEELLDSLLDLSRLDAGVLQPNVTAIALQHCFDRLDARFSESARKRGLRLQIRPSSAWAHSDPILLERILSNLLSNAIRYTPSGRILLAARRRGARWRIEVRDSGIGIPADAQDIIFHEFVQLDPASGHQHQGMGLGLTIVRRLADLLGHRIALRSQPQRGSVFAIELPAANPHPAPDIAPDASPPAQTLAVVGRNQSARAELAALLGDWDYRVCQAEDAPSLMQALADNPQQLQALLCECSDLSLDAGLALINTCLKALDRPDLPAVLLSVDCDPECRSRAQQAGVTLLSSPLRPARLRAVLNRLQSNTASETNGQPG